MDQGNDWLVLGDLGIKGLLVGDVEGNGSCELDTFCQLLGTLESSAS
jgi:hypothetical protein